MSTNTVEGRRPLHEQLITVVRLRKFCRYGKDDEGNCVSELMPRILADEERKLGQLYADWFEGLGRT